MNTSLRARSLCALIIAANAGALSLPFLAQAQPKPAPKPASARPVTGNAAEVNGEKLSNAEVERHLAVIRAANPPLQADTAEAREALQNIRANVVDSLIDFRLEVQEARKLKLAATPAQIEEAVANQRKKFRTDQEMKSAMAAAGRSLAEFRTYSAEDIMVAALEGRWAASVVVSEAEISEAYRANITRFADPERVRARHILVSFGVQNPTADDKAKALKKAQGLLAKANAPGTDFGLLAKDNSDDPGSRATGGDLGSFPRGTMVPTFEEAAFAAKVGDIVGPVESPFGYHLIKVEEKFPARTYPLEQVREPLRGVLLKEKREKTVFDKIAALRGNARIKKNG